MRIEFMSMENYSWGEPKGFFVLSDEEATIRLKLKRDDVLRIAGILEEIFLRDQPTLAKKVASIQPQALPAPSIAEGEFTEISDKVSF